MNAEYVAIRARLIASMKSCLFAAMDKLSEEERIKCKDKSLDIFKQIAEFSPVEQIAISMSIATSILETANDVVEKMMIKKEQDKAKEN